MNVVKWVHTGYTRNGQMIFRPVFAGEDEAAVVRAHWWDGRGAQ